MNQEKSRSTTKMVSQFETQVTIQNADGDENIAGGMVFLEAKQHVAQIDR